MLFSLLPNILIVVEDDCLFENIIILLHVVILHLQTASLNSRLVAAAVAMQRTCESEQQPIMHSLSHCVCKPFRR